MQKPGRGEEIAKRERRESAQIVLGKKKFLRACFESGNESLYLHVFLVLKGEKGQNFFVLNKLVTASEV